MVEYLEVGKIVNTHGVKGEVRVLPLTDDPGRFKKLEWVYLRKNDMLDKLNINSVKYLKNFVILKFEGIDDVNAAETLKELFILVDREHAVKLPEGSYFICDLLGSKVYSIDGTLLGELVKVLQTGSNDVYVVKGSGANGREILIPALKSVVRSISLEEGKIVVELPAGLID